LAGRGGGGRCGPDAAADVTDVTDGTAATTALAEAAGGLPNGFPRETTATLATTDAVVSSENGVGLGSWNKSENIYTYF
jgi:hypothetical protein